MFTGASFTLPFAILLTTSFVVVGLISCWAVNLPRHWFARTGIVLFFLSPLLWGAAFEPFLILILESVTIMLGIAIGPFVQQRMDRQTSADGPTEQPPKLSQFSLLSVLLLIGLAASLLGIVIRMPTLNRYAWQSIVLTGTASGLSLLVAYWTARSESRWWIRLCVLVLASIVIAIPLVLIDWLVYAFTGWTTWPPDPPDPAIAAFLMGFDDRYTLEWFGICPAIAVLSWILLSMFGSRAGDCSVGKPSRNRRWTRLAAISLWLTLAMVPGYALWVIVRPPEYIERPLAEANHYDQMIGFALAIERSKFKQVEVGWDTAPKAALAPAIADIEATITQLRKALRLSIQVPLRYDATDIDVNEMQRVRSTARALAANSRLLILDGKHDEAFEMQLDSVRYGFAMRKRGLLVHGLVGIACSNQGISPLYKNRDQFSPQSCRNAARELLRILDSAEVAGSFIIRDRGWIQSTGGWHGRICQTIEDIQADETWTVTQFRLIFQSERAEICLLATELALSAYSVDHDSWPESLDQLVPQYLPTVPVDPYDPYLGPLRYAREADGFRLYSVGPNQIDESGLAARDYTQMMNDPNLPGDLMLDVRYGDDTIGP